MNKRDMIDLSTNEILEHINRLEYELEYYRTQQSNAQVEEAMKALKYISNFTCFHNNAYKDKLDSIHNALISLTTKVSEPKSQEQLREEIIQELNDEINVDDFSFNDFNFWSDKAMSGCDFDKENRRLGFCFYVNIKFSTCKKIIEFYDFMNEVKE